jgi:multiple sugar transport system permease protein
MESKSIEGAAQPSPVVDAPANPAEKGASKGMRSPRKPRREKQMSLSKKEVVAGYLMISPWIIYFLVFIAVPMFGAFAISFTNWDILTGPKWIGIKNFQDLFKDNIFWVSVYNTLFYTLLAIPLHIFTALVTALLMNIRTKFIGIYRTLFYLPCIISPVAIGLIWMWLLYPDFGLVNVLLRSVGLPGLKWLYDAHLSKWIIIAINTWQFGSTMVIFLAALQDVPKELYEAAQIDGANFIDRIRNITLPMISPVIFYVLVLQTIGSFQVFTYSYVMTKGGPSNSTMFTVLYIWKNAFEYFRMGYASAMGVILFIITLLFTLLEFWISKFWVHYESV